jgi:hypothetical protein
VDEVTGVYQSAVATGLARLDRTWPALLATGTIGGFDVSVGVFAYLLVETETGNRPLGSLAFTIGFIALSLGRSELFTENFLVPIAAAVAGKAVPAWPVSATSVPPASASGNRPSRRRLRRRGVVVVTSLAVNCADSARGTVGA